MSGTSIIDKESIRNNVRVGKVFSVASSIVLPVVTDFIFLLLTVPAGTKALVGFATSGMNDVHQEVLEAPTSPTGLAEVTEINRDRSSSAAPLCSVQLGGTVQTGTITGGTVIETIIRPNGVTPTAMDSLCNAPWLLDVGDYALRATALSGSVQRTGCEIAWMEFRA